MFFFVFLSSPPSGSEGSQETDVSNHIYSVLVWFYKKHIQIDNLWHQIKHTQTDLGNLFSIFSSLQMWRRKTCSLVSIFFLYGAMHLLYITEAFNPDDVMFYFYISFVYSDLLFFSKPTPRFRGTFHWTKPAGKSLTR